MSSLVDGKGQPNVINITRDENAWRSRLIQTENVHWDFLTGQPITPEVCYEVEPIQYRWNKGIIYPLAALERPRVTLPL